MRPSSSSAKSKDTVKCRKQKDEIGTLASAHSVYQSNIKLVYKHYNRPLRGKESAGIYKYIKNIS